MMTRKDLLQSPEYWFEEAQNELYRQVTDYMKTEGLNQSQLAEKLSVSKGYVSQVLKGEFNYTLKKLIELSLAVGKIPQIEYKPFAQVLGEDMKSKFILFTGDGSKAMPLSISPASTASTMSGQNTNYGSSSQAA